MSKAETKTVIESNIKNESSTPNDPFGVDIFNESRPTEPLQTNIVSSLIIEPVQEAVPDEQPAPSWSRNLPKLSREEAKTASLFSAACESISPDAVNGIIQILSFYTKTGPERIAIEKVLVSQMDMTDFLYEAQKTPCVFLSLTVEPRTDNLYVCTDAGFATSIVNLLLGGDGTPPLTLRQLSKTERAVVEFLSLACARALNKFANTPWLKLSSVTDSFPETRKRVSSPTKGEETSAQKEHSDNEAGIFFCLRLVVGQVSGLVRIFASHKTFAAIDRARNPLFIQTEENRLSRFKTITGDVSTRISIGETEIETTDLIALEAGDAVLIERPFVQFMKGQIAGKINLFVGDGENFTISGAISSGERTKFQIKEIKTPSETPEIKRSRMEERENINPTTAEESGINISQMALTVRVELASQRMTLEEISSLREGQVIELGCSPNDPVNLVTENGRIASGELVEIEGRLGVRINQVFV